MISIETMTLPAADNGTTVVMLLFKDEHDRKLGKLLFSQVSDQAIAIMSFEPGNDIVESRLEPDFGDSPGSVLAFLHVDESKKLPMRADLPTELPDNVRRLFPHPEDE